MQCQESRLKSIETCGTLSARGPDGHHPDAARSVRRILSRPVDASAAPPPPVPPRRCRPGRIRRAARPYHRGRAIASSARMGRRTDVTSRAGHRRSPGVPADRAAVVGVRQLRHPVQGVRPGGRAARPVREDRRRGAGAPATPGVAPTVALHIPWDQVDDYADLAGHAADLRRRARDDQLERVPGRRLHARQRLPPRPRRPRARRSTTCSSASTSWTRPGRAT